VSSQTKITFEFILQFFLILDLIFVTISLLTITEITYCTVCPPEQMIKPCKCVGVGSVGSVGIQCVAHENIDLKHIFYELSLNLEDGKKNFSQFQNKDNELIFKKFSLAKINIFLSNF
jgi:hypothetical protein